MIWLYAAAADLPALPAQSRLAPEDFSLLPPLRGGEDGWEFVGKKGATKAFEKGSKGSALTGEYKAPEPLVASLRPGAAAPAAPTPAAAAAPAVAAEAPKAAPK